MRAVFLLGTLQLAQPKTGSCDQKHAAIRAWRKVPTSAEWITQVFPSAVPSVLPLPLAPCPTTVSARLTCTVRSRFHGCPAAAWHWRSRPGLPAAGRSGVRAGAAARQGQENSDSLRMRCFGQFKAGVKHDIAAGQESRACFEPPAGRAVRRDPRWSCPWGPEVSHWNLHPPRRLAIPR